MFALITMLEKGGSCKEVKRIYVINELQIGGSMRGFGSSFDKSETNQKEVLLVAAASVNAVPAVQ